MPLRIISNLKSLSFLHFFKKSTLLILATSLSFDIFIIAYLVWFVKHFFHFFYFLFQCFLFPSPCNNSIAQGRQKSNIQIAQNFGYIFVQFARTYVLCEVPKFRDNLCAILPLDIERKMCYNKSLCKTRRASCVTAPPKLKVNMQYAQKSIFIFVKIAENKFRHYAQKAKALQPPPYSFFILLL